MSKISAKTGRVYGWTKDVMDHRDYMFKVTAPVPVPATLDLSLLPNPPIFNQTTLGSCTSMGIGDAHMYDQIQQNPTTAFMPSHLFIYFNERKMEGTIKSDAGGQIRDGIKSVAAQGVCPETMWPYNISKFTNTPPAACYTEALKHKALLYQRVGYLNGSVDQASLQQAVASMKRTVPLGIPVYASFESAAVAKTGIVPMPKKGEQLLGGHCIDFYGWVLIKGVLYWKLKNSWGPAWGDKGFFYLPIPYVQYMSDAWLIQTVATAAAAKFKPFNINYRRARATLALR